MKFKEKSFREKSMTISALATTKGKLNFSQEDYVDMLRFVADLINSHEPEKQISVVIIEKEAKKHKLDIQDVKDNIFIQRDTKQDALTADEINAIQELRDDGYSKSEIARAFGYSRNTVNKYLK